MKTTTDPQNFVFSFTVTDLARFLGKSPVTLRHWERQGLVTFPRDGNGDRRLTTGEIRLMARIASKLGRISDERLYLVEATVTLLEMVEQRNNAENRAHRGTVIRQNGASPSTGGSLVGAAS
jgi:predicted site-specific integrase-resolvase